MVIELNSKTFEPSELLKEYKLDIDSIHIGCIASHSALDVFDGAKDEGLRTLAVCERGREKPYLHFKRIVDKVVILDRFANIINKDIINKLKDLNIIFVPNRSFAVYVGYDNIEMRFPVPIFGNRYMLRWEERSGSSNYYKLLDKANIRRPKTFQNPDEIDRPVIVKLPHAKKRVERGFFIAVDSDDFYKKARKLVEANVIKWEDLRKASIEELILGAHFNVNYFHSIALGRIELLSIDRRIQTNLDGVLRLPAKLQLDLKDIAIEYIEIGHEPATVRERMLIKLIDIGERFVEASKRLILPGIIGPFTLQLMITPELEVVVFDVATRIGGGTNIYMGIGSQYSKLYFGKPISMGRRIAMEIKMCIEQGCIDKVVT